jgi:hypothetical protein
MRNVRLFLILGLGVLTLLVMNGCRDAGPATQSSERSPDWAPPQLAGNIQSDDLKESSGLAVSKCQPNVLWTHNDQGSGPFIYALSGDGKHLGTWHVPNAQNVDWEDIASYKEPSGTCYLYIGDTGDNDEARSQLTIYRVSEPQVKPEDASSDRKNPLQTEPPETMTFTYGDSKNNAEALLVHPQTGNIYVVTKHNKKPAFVYKIDPGFGKPETVTAQRVAEISMPADPPGRITGGAISPDARRVILCDVQGGYELVLPKGDPAFDDIWKQKPLMVDLGDRKQGEGVSYNADGTAIYAGSEKKNSAIYLIKRK